MYCQAEVSIQKTPVRSLTLGRGREPQDSGSNNRGFTMKATIPTKGTPEAWTKRQKREHWTSKHQEEQETRPLESLGPKGVRKGCTQQSLWLIKSPGKADPSGVFSQIHECGHKDYSESDIVQSQSLWESSTPVLYTGTAKWLTRSSHKAPCDTLCVQE